MDGGVSRPNRGLYEAIVLWRSEVVDRVSRDMLFEPYVRTAEAFVAALLERLETEAMTGERAVVDAWLRSLASLEPLADYPALVDSMLSNLIALSGALAPPTLGRVLLARRDDMLSVMRAGSSSISPSADPAWAAARAVHAMVESYDANYGAHSQVVSDLAVRVGDALQLAASDVAQLRIAALVHDAGMVTISSDVLSRTTDLSDEDWERIRRHPETGARLLEEVPLLAQAVPAVRAHHERFDGTGYPSGLAGERIPLFARIIAVADAFQALTSVRPHRPALTTGAALAAMHEGRGAQWDPLIVDVLATTLSGYEARLPHAV